MWAEHGLVHEAGAGRRAGNKGGRHCLSAHACEHSDGGATNAPMNEAYLRTLWEQVLVFLVSGSLQGQGGPAASTKSLQVPVRPFHAPTILLTNFHFPQVSPGRSLMAIFSYSAAVRRSCYPVNHQQGPDLTRRGSGHLTSLGTAVTVSRMRLLPAWRPRQHQRFPFLASFPPGTHGTFLSSSGNGLLNLIKRMAPHGHSAGPMWVASTPPLTFHPGAVCWVP